VPYCTNCGEEVTDEQRYCSYCGEPVGDVSRREAGGRGQPDQPASQAHDPQNDPPDRATQPGGFEGDPPPDGYEDPPGVGQRRDRQSTVPDAIGLYGSSLRQILGYPVMLAGLFLAWLGFFLFDQVSPAVQLPGIVLTGLLGLFVAGMIHVAVERARDGQEPTTGERASQVTSAFAGLVGIWLLFVPAMLLGLAFFLLPGLYIAGRLFLAFPACVLDGESALESLSTSWELTGGVSLKPFGLLVVAVLAALILSILFSLISPGLVLASGADVPAEPGQPADEVADRLADQPRFLVAAALSQSAALAIVVGAVQIAAARLYLSLRYGGHKSGPQ